MTLSDAQCRALALLASRLEPDAYLAGGVAVSLTLGHRTSIDLDFFIPHDFDSERLSEELFSSLPPSARAREIGRARGTLHFDVEGVPVSILSYRYPLLESTYREPTWSIKVASTPDLVCMKLSAIAGRGAAKDFWDLEAMLAHGAAEGSLAAALELFAKKYAATDLGHVVRSLAYFGEADAAPLPRGLSAASWELLKDRMRARVLSL